MSAFTNINIQATPDKKTIAKNTYSLMNDDLDFCLDRKTKKLRYLTWGYDEESELNNKTPENQNTKPTNVYSFMDSDDDESDISTSDDLSDEEDFDDNSDDDSIKSTNDISSSDEKSINNGDNKSRDNISLKLLFL